jgi:hypothetical protein
MNHASAYISITGYLLPYKQQWVPQTVQPIDGNGHSLAGASESSQEAFYNALDNIIMAANRNAPTSINEPSDYSGSFINSDESEVVPGIGYALIQLNINPASFPAGSPIMVKFEDGTSAIYIKASAGANYQWTWSGVAYKGKQQINRNGTPAANSNTPGSGSGSAGSATLGGFGPEATGWTWFAAADPDAPQGPVITITVGAPIPDENSNYDAELPPG